MNSDQNFKESLKLYAQLIVTHGLNVQPGQIVNISAEPFHKDLTILIAQAAYERGAKFVNVDLTDMRLLKMRILQTQEEDLKYVPSYVGMKYAEMVDTTGANLKIVGPEDPDLLSDLDPKKINIQRLHQRLALQYFYDEGIGKSKVQWTVVAAATPAWAKRIFPNLSDQDAYKQLWQNLFSICRVDQPNCLQLWQDHDRILKHRADALNKMEIKELKFKGPGTDLTVGLHQRARFRGGTDQSPRKVPFEPNLPTEEVFTTPDYRVTSGKVQTTRPFLINGKLIKGLNVEFKGGEIVNFTAESGSETFAEYISSDPGAKRLGEVALVGIDSPIYKTGLIFEEILLDENAACHIAIGSAYKFCLENGDNVDSKIATEIGCNESSVHTDMMISSEKVDVTALTYGGNEVEIIKKGAWVEL